MNIKNVVVVGGGVLGSQIAFQTAYCGFNVSILAKEKDIDTVVRPKLDNLENVYKKAIKDMANNKDKKNWCRGIADFDKFDEKECLDKVDKASKSIKIIFSQEEALKDADLVIESITENLNIKNEFYSSIADLLPEETIVVTNSSTLLPSQMAKSTKRPDRFLSLHFANNIWKNNTAEVMGHSETNKDCFDKVVEFANDIRMIALPVYKEKKGYLLNSMLVPFLLSAFDLFADGISDPESIDKAWTYGTGAPEGPFKIMDVVGLETVKNIVEQYKKVPELLDPLFKKMLLPYSYKEMLEILNKYIEEGKTGKAAGEGFYKYDKK